jgi:hypothetical protein
LTNCARFMIRPCWLLGERKRIDTPILVRIFGNIGYSVAQNLLTTGSWPSVGSNASGEAAVYFAFGCNRSGLQIELAKYRLQPELGRLSYPFVCSCVPLSEPGGRL